MLLARREGQDEAALALGVDRLAAQPAGHLTDVLLAAGEQAEIGPAELEPVADRLAFADDDVGPHLAGRADQPERDRFGHDGDQQRAGGVGGLGERRQVGDMAENVGVLDDDALVVRIDRWPISCSASSSGVKSGSGVDLVFGECAIVFSTLT